MKSRTTRAALLLIAAPLLLTGCLAPRVTTRSLLADMTNLDQVAEFPRPPFTCRQASSYDRASVSPDDAKAWFANDDAGQFLRVEQRGERQEYVMLDTRGPGAIVRIWSANPKGTLRVYLDHSDTPALEAPMSTLLGGQFPGLPEPLACMRSAGWSLYFPIPYARHCEVTCDDNSFYYHINYRIYSFGTRVTSFRPSDLQDLANEIGAVAAALTDPHAHSPALAETLRPGLQRLVHEKGIEIRPGESLPGPLIGHGQGALVGLRINVDADDRELALRQLLLTMEFDGEETVACPLGDFFGAGPGARPYDSLPLGITDDGTLWCDWVMPYHRSVKLAIRNDGLQTVRLRLSATTDTEFRWNVRSMHFHAGWHVARDVPTRPRQDWNYVTVRGTGVFVGAAFSIANPVKAWWGEGDEKIYVDNDKFPSHFGTGTEDYYGYAWCSPELFTHAYHAQPQCDGPSNYGRTAVNRWHILDRIPFQHDFRFDMELWHWSDVRIPEMSVVTYWYARPGATSNCTTPSPRDLRVVELAPYVAPRVPGAIEGEKMRILASTGEVGPQDISNCSNDQQLWWRGNNVGDRLVLAFDVARAGRYRVWGRFVHAKDYGVANLTLNDAPVAQPLDLYAPNLGLTDEIDLGEFDLPSGENKLTVEITGKNPESIGHMFGLDYLRLETTP